METLSQGERRPPSASPLLLTKETCCFPETQTPDDMERFMGFVRPLDYFLLLFMHMDTGGTVRGDVNLIKSCFTALGVRVTGVITHTISPQT